MQKTFYLVLFVACALLIYKAIIPKYKFRYYYSKDRFHILTRIDYPNNWFHLNQTYFTPGFYRARKVPKTYFKPLYSTDWDWGMYVTFHSKGIFIEGAGEGKNFSDSFQYIKTSGLNYNEELYKDSLKKSFHDTSYAALYWDDR